MKVFFPLAKRSFPLAFFLLIGFCLWFTSVQPHISAQATPQISTVSIKNTTLLVKGQNLTAAAIEVDGVRLDDTKAAASGKKLKSKQGGTLAPGSYIVTVRTQSNQRSAPVIFDNQVSQPPKVTLALTAVSVQLPAGTTLQVTATARDAAGGELTGVNYTWRSTNPAVATVSPTGVVSGLAEGTTQVVVSALRNEALLEIKVLGGESGTPASITVIPANPVLNETETLQLKAEVRDASGNVVANAPVTWSSDNTSQVAIDAGGTVQAVKRGFAAVTAKSGTLQTIVSVAVVKVESGNPASSGGPGEVRTDLANRVYQTDLAQHVVRRGEFGKPLEVYTGEVNAPGRSDGTLAQARYNGPLGIGIDNQDGDVFLADTANQVIRSISSRNGRVVTLAGVAGQAGYRDGPLDQALFNSPRGVVMSSDGNVYVADGLNHVIRVIDTRRKEVRTLAGSPGVSGLADGSKGNARFNQPQGLSLDTSNRNIVVADTANNRIRLVTPEGQVLTLGALTGSRKPVYNQWQHRSSATLTAPGSDFQKTFQAQGDTSLVLDQPRAVSVDKIGTIYVTDSQGVQVLPTRGGRALGQFPLADSRTLGSVSGVTVASVEGNFAGGTRANAVVVNSQVNGQSQLVRVTVGVPSISSILPQSAPVGGGTEVTVAGVNFTPDMQVFLDGAEVNTLNIEGSTQFTFVTPVLTESGLRTLTVQGRGGSRQFPFFLKPPAFDDIGPGDITTFVGGTTYVGDGGEAIQCTLAGPSGLSIDVEGNLLLVDSYNNRIRQVDFQTNLITSIAGRGTLGATGDGGSALQASLGTPEDVITDFDGNFFVSDSDNFRIRRIDAVTGKISTYAGGEEGFGGDGGPATEAKLGRPAGLALDEEGNLYIADPENQRIRRVSPAGVITTIAGIGNRGYSGDGGPAVQALLNTPTDVAVDESGNVFIADEGNNCIRHIDPAGVITTLAGQGFGPTLRSPHGIEYAGGGYLLIADTFSSCVRVLEINSGLHFVVAGREGQFGISGDGGPSTDALLSGPTHITLDGAGNLYISDAFNNRIRRVDGETLTISTYVGTGALDFLPDGLPGAVSRLYYPEGLHLDGQGGLYICEPYIGRVRRLDISSQSLSIFAGVFDFDKPASGDGGPARGAALVSPARTVADAQGNVYILDNEDGAIRRVDAATQTISTFAGNPNGSLSDGQKATDSRLVYPMGAAFGPDGNLYFAEAGTNRVRRVVMATGIIETVVGRSAVQGFSGDGGPAITAQLSAPFDVAFDRTGRLYIADAGNHRVRVVDPSGRISTLAGNGETGFNGDNRPASIASLTFPISLAIDGANNVLIADYQDARVRLVNTATQLITTVAGNGQYGSAGDGGPATAAQLFGPADIAVDSLGNLVISDQINNRIRVVRQAVQPVR